MRLRPQLAVLTILLIAFSLLSACSSRSYVRHIASDLCLVVPQQSTKKEIITLMGAPDLRTPLPENREKWTYIQDRKSLMRKTPYIGDKIGYENYDIGLIIFNGETVETINYRQFTEQEFRESGINTTKSSDAE